MRGQSTSSARRMPLAPGGCVFAEDPERPAGEARLFWHADRDPMTIRAMACPCPGGDPDAFDIRTLPMPAAILKDAAGEEVAIRCGELTVRLSILSGTLLTGPVMLDFRLGGCRHLERRLLALRQFDAVLRRGHMPRTLLARPRDTTRSASILRTLNALADHGSARAVATELYGAQKVEADWTHDSDYLRMATRRLIGRARHLATGGYLGLLG